MIQVNSKSSSKIRQLRLKSYLSIGFWLLLAGSSMLDANDATNAESTSTNKVNEFRLPARNKTPENSDSKTDIKSIFGETGIKIGIVIGILSIAVIILAKRKDNSTIPREAIEILGSVPMSARQSVQLIRFGQKLVLVESAATGLKPISEITDPAEVDRMLNLIQSKVR